MYISKCHISIFQEKLIKVKSLLQELNSDLHILTCNTNEIHPLLDHAEKQAFQKNTIPDCIKCYKIYKASDSLNYVEFYYYHRAPEYPDSAGPDYYFGHELIELSKLIKSEIFYIWEQHINRGWEVFKNGECINSVISSTHGPYITVDGQEVKIPEHSILLGMVKTYDTTKIIDENSHVPTQIRETCNYKYIRTLSYEYLIFISKSH
jgi:hypothetical protein